MDPLDPTPDAQTPRSIDRLRAQDLPVAFAAFRLTGLLGEGGMARVFRAERLGRDGSRQVLALKVLRRDVGGPVEQVLRALKAEARLGRALQHANIVRTYDIDSVQGRPCIALELVDGVTLHRLVRDGDCLTAEQIIGVGVQIAGALHAAHNTLVDGLPLGLVHRDLKPANVMLDRRGRVKLMDFGVAKAAQSGWNGATTERGRVKGTPVYMAPEQARGLAVDGRTDLFALGAILYELFSGQRLFEGRSIPSVLARVMCVEPLLERDSAFQRMRRAHPGLAAVVASCLRLRPQDRPDGALQVAQALARLPADAAVGRVLAARVRELLGRDPAETPTRRMPSCGGAQPPPETAQAPLRLEPIDSANPPPAPLRTACPLNR